MVGSCPSSDDPLILGQVRPAKPFATFLANLNTSIAISVVVVAQMKIHEGEFTGPKKVGCSPQQILTVYASVKYV